ncbi:MAG TPA: SpvB/TcaC N-terminal domain-containing protein [Roseiflexaceae bacterium]|nr:SpvB/TcaC N-terminal domain-containing protein [Roseiflexaceae bacterium]
MSTDSDPIRLPSGGGALAGLGETFQPDLHTGTGNFSVPILLPEGRPGLQPQLTLTYSTGHGNGPFGLGWSLSSPAVTRKTARGVPRYQPDDTFVLAGAEDLVALDSRGQRFRPRTEGLFALIGHHQHGEAGDFWEVRSKNGLVSRYGTPDLPASDPAAAVVADPAWRAQPAGAPRIFAWRLSSTTDPFGNTVRYDYLRDSGDDGARRWDQLYLQRIRYLDYTGQDGPAFLVRVVLHYGERPDPFSDHRAGFAVRTRLRCERLDVLVDAGDTQLVRSYRFAYSADPYNGVSLLRQVGVVGSDEQELLPPLEFDYTSFAPDQRRFRAVGGADLPVAALAGNDYALADLFGSGLPDLVQLNGVARYWRNQGGGSFDMPRSMPTAPAGVGLADEGVQLIDATGDGRPDLLVTRGPLSGYYTLDQAGGWDQASFQRYPSAPSFNLRDPEVRLVDLDGDGVTDALRSGSTFECYFNDPQQGWYASRRVARGSLEHFPDVSFADPHVKWADMSGDGLQDIVLVRRGQICYWPNLGHGNWGRRIVMRGSLRLPPSYNPANVLLGDVDGDGAADLVYVDNNSVTLWLNRSGDAWSDPISIPGTPPVADGDSLQIVDLYGSGVAGLLWGSGAGRADRGLRFLDFTGGQKPYLLCRMDNNIGATTQVEYAPSTRDYLADQARPETRWRTPLPFPVQVVARVTTTDRLSGGRLVTDYRYHHGYWDGGEREFRGFGRVDQIDTPLLDDVPAQQRTPPTLTKTWFHQGPVGPEFGAWVELDLRDEFWPGDPVWFERPRWTRSLLARLPRRVQRDALRTLRGQVLRSELYALDGSERAARPYRVSETLPELCAVVPEGQGVRLVIDPAELPADWATDASAPRIFFRDAPSQRSTVWERGDDPQTTVSFTDDRDAFGQPRRQTTIALPRRQRYRAAFTGVAVGTLPGDTVNEARVLASHTSTAYALPDAGVFIHDRVAQVYRATLDPAPTIAEQEPDNLARVLAEQAAAAQAIRARFNALPAPTEAGGGLPEGVRLLGHTVSHYDGAAFVGRPVGQLGPHGALTRVEELLVTEAQLDAAYGPLRPAYLDGPAALPPGAPAGFGADLGYRRSAATAEGYHAGYYSDTTRLMRDVQRPDAAQGRGAVLAQQDPRGNTTAIALDPYWHLPAGVTDPLGLTTQAEYDYRTMQPRRVTDPNGTSSLFGYTPLGLLAWQCVQSRDGAGGTPEQPDTSYTYDLWAFRRTRDQDQPQPIFCHTRRRVWHASEAISDEQIEARAYSDGFGRVIQQRAQAGELAFGADGGAVGLGPVPGGAPAPAAGQRTPDRVVVSGWKRYDNKGQPIAQYEPFFANGWGFQPEAEAGLPVRMRYDPLGRLTRTIQPDGGETWVLAGVPRRLHTPEDVVPTPWESYTYDANDLAPRLRGPDGQPLAAPPAHHFTPASALVDALGRTICQVARNGADPASDWSITRVVYDPAGNPLATVDALGRPALQQRYDLAGRCLRTESIDTGVRTVVYSAQGQPVEARDADGRVILRRYDALGRPVELWASNSATTPVALRERLHYGDDSADPAQRAAYQLGRLVAHYDGAGVQLFERYDFAGRLCEKARRVPSDPALRQGWSADWSAAGAEDALEERAHQTSTRYDALGRARELRAPADHAGQRAVLTPRYNRAGALEAVALDGAPFVSQIAYNARGQRVLVAYGNRTLTRYVYDPRSKRLLRMRSERCLDAAPADDRWVGQGAPLQDIGYSYDPVGNLTATDERTPGCGIAGQPDGRDRLRRVFSYDPLYRLAQSRGRACAGIGNPRPSADTLRCGGYPAPAGGAPTPNQDNAPDLTELAVESYFYDPAGNLTDLVYASASATWARHYHTGGAAHDKWANATSHRLTGLTHGGITEGFAYDASGNMVRQNTERHFGWDASGQLVSFRIQPEGAALPSVEARYLYGADGQRVKKWVRTGGSGPGDSTVSIDGLFELHTWQETGDSQPRQHALIHLLDGGQRIALVRRGPARRDDAGPAVQFHLADHLGSSSVVVDDGGAWVNREEYSPYGETLFGSFARKRYRFAGKERDAESGLYAFGARFYAPWLGRWISADPAGMVDGPNLYRYTRNNPLNHIDPTGTSSIDLGLFEVVKDMPENFWSFAGELDDLDAIDRAIEEADEIRFHMDNIDLELMQDKFEDIATYIEEHGRDGLEEYLRESESMTAYELARVMDEKYEDKLSFQVNGKDRTSKYIDKVRDVLPEDLQETIASAARKVEATATKELSKGIGEAGNSSGEAKGLGKAADTAGDAAKAIPKPPSKALKLIPIVGTAAGLASAAAEAHEGNYVRAGVDTVGVFVEPVDWAATAYDAGAFVYGEAKAFTKEVIHHIRYSPGYLSTFVDGQMPYGGRLIPSGPLW